MGTRRVTATIKDIEGDPIAGASVSFILDRSTFVTEEEENYPPGQITVVTGADGRVRSSENELGVDLWANSNSANQARYECILPNNDRFSFLLASGESPVDLTALRAANLVPFDESTSVTLQELIDAALAPLYEELDLVRTAWSDGLVKESLSARLSADFTYLEGEGAVIDVDVEEFEPPPRNATLLVDTTENAVAINLLETAQLSGRRYLVKLVAGANEVTFDALPDVVLAALKESVTLLYDGANWIVAAQYP